MLLDVKDVNKIYNGEILFEHISFSVNDNDRIGLVGVNGCGKSTLIKIIIGEELPDHLSENDSAISYSGKTAIGYLAQTDALDSEKTIIEEMRGVFSKLLETEKDLRELENSGKADTDEYAEKLAWFESNDGYNIDVKIKTVLNGMGFGDILFDRKVSGFSGGEKTRLAIAKLLLEEPNLLILDEPTNHLDFASVSWLEEYLVSYKGAVIVVSHDQYFLDKVATTICEIENGTLTRYKGNYTKYSELKKEKIARLEKEYEIQQKQIEKLQDYVDRNIVRATTSKRAKSKQKALEKIEPIENPRVYRKRPRLSFNNYFIEPPQEVLYVKDIDLTVGEGDKRKTLLDEISFTVRRGEKFGIVGENGIGKSTLLKALQNIIPHKGLVRWNMNVKYAYFEQESSNLDKSLSVIDTLKVAYPSMTDYDARSLLGSLGITGEEVFKLVGDLSGGERAKICFALMTLEHANVLILDEPTNHLDIETKEVLEEALESYTGTLIFVSHDRYLLNKVATSVFELTREGTELFKGGFDDYITEKNRRNDAQIAAEEARKRQIEFEKIQNKKENVYKSKQQRKEAAQKRARIKELENLIDENQKKIDELQAEVSSGKISDFKEMNEKCALIEKLSKDNDDYFDEICELE